MSTGRTCSERRQGFGPVAGLTVLTSDSLEVVLVNVMGDLKPEFFSDTMVALDVDVAPKVQLAAAH